LKKSYGAAAATIFSKRYRYRYHATAAMTFSKTCRGSAAMDISES
jgi:hypothetical protein